MVRSPIPLTLVLALGATLSASAQPAPAPAAKNFVGNGGFESSFRRDELWDGVDTSGALAGERRAMQVLTGSGTIADTSMPVSVAIADMNGDGLPDIVTCDVLGYVRIYFNSGTKTEPKFTSAELAAVFLSRPSPELPDPLVRRAPRISVADFAKSGKNDLLVGNYFGEVLLIPNAGTSLKPDFRQPADLSKAAIPTNKNANEKWGNVFAPAVWDWNGDGKSDILVGEGSYSANNIHLLINEGTGGAPKFSESNRAVLAYGMGLEQLSVAVVDYNGDGKPDLLVTERSGKVAVYLNPGTPWKPGQTIPFESFITAGGAAPSIASKDPMDAAKATNLISLGGISTVATGDLNGDGNFDLVFGKSNGRVAVSYNTGTKTAPKFAAPVELKGQSDSPPLGSPSGWEMDFGLERGNFYGFGSVVKADADPKALPSEGTACFKSGYLPSQNKYLPIPSPQQYFSGDSAKYKPGRVEMFGAKNEELPSNTFKLTQAGRFPLENKKSYVFTMKVKGERVSDAAVRIYYVGEKKLSDEKIVQRGDRNSVTVQKNEAKEEKSEFFTFTPGASWAEVKKEFTVKFDDRDLSDVTKVPTWETGIMYTLAPGAGTLYIDDIKIIEK